MSYTNEANIGKTIALLGKMVFALRGEYLKWRPQDPNPEQLVRLQQALNDVCRFLQYDPEKSFHPRDDQGGPR
jgi:hypothetical protein